MSRKILYVRRQVENPSDSLLSLASSDIQHMNIFQSIISIMRYLNRYKNRQPYKPKEPAKEKCSRKTRIIREDAEPAQSDQICNAFIVEQQYEIQKEQKYDLFQQAFMNDSMHSSSSHRRHLIPQSDDQPGHQNQFEVVNTMEIQQLLKKTHAQVQENKRHLENKLKRLRAVELLNETHDERVLNKYEDQVSDWDRLNRIIRRKKSKSTLIECQSDYRKRMESYELFQSLKPMESLHSVISWPSRLRQPYVSDKQIRTEDNHRRSKLQSILNTIQPKDIENPLKLLEDVYAPQEPIKYLKLCGQNVLQRECQQIRNVPLSQKFYLYKM